MAESTTPKATVEREVILLIVGALISGITGITTNWLNDRSESRRNNIEKKFEVNDQLAKDLGLRLFLTNEVYKARAKNDSGFHAYLSKYLQSKEDWNIKFLSYQSLLQSYYGPEVLTEFARDIYNPLVLLGQEAEYNKFDSLFSEKHAALRKKQIDFISKIYNLAQE